MKKISTILLVSVLMMVNFTVDYNLKPFNLQVEVESNQAEARSSVSDYVMETETCWVNGESIQICRYSPGDECNVSGQDTCSSSDPGSGN